MLHFRVLPARGCSFSPLSSLHTILQDWETLFCPWVEKREVREALEAPTCLVFQVTNFLRLLRWGVFYPPAPMERPCTFLKNIWKIQGRQWMCGHSLPSVFLVTRVNWDHLVNQTRNSLYPHWFTCILFNTVCSVRGMTPDSWKILLRPRKF